MGTLGVPASWKLDRHPRPEQPQKEVSLGFYAPTNPMDRYAPLEGPKETPGGKQSSGH